MDSGEPLVFVTVASVVLIFTIGLLLYVNRKSHSSESKERMGRWEELVAFIKEAFDRARRRK